MQAQVRSAILVADTLIDEYRVVVKRYLDALTHDRAHTDGESMRAELERVYTNIWEQLDTAANLTRSANRSAAAYDELRRDPRLDVGAAVSDVKEQYLGTVGNYATSRVTVHHNGDGVAIARGAAATLRGAWPDIDWTPPAPMPDVDLRPRGLLSRLFGRR